MEGTENNLPDEQNANAGIAGAENPGGESTEQQPSQDDLVREWFKAKGKEVDNLDDLLKEPEKIVEIKEVDPYEGLFDEDDKAYLNFKKETGRSRKDFEALNKNYDDVDPLEFAREQVRRETGQSQISDAAIDQYIAEKLGIDLDELSDLDKLKIAGYGKSIKDEKKAEQEKYRKPAENKQPQQDQPTGEMLRLENGALIPKTDYEKLVAERQKHIEEAKEAVNHVTESSFKIAVDDNGTQRELNYKYEYAEQDVQNMASIVSDVDSVIQKRYSTENGFNHKSFAEDMLWSDQKFREKAISDLVTKARAEAIEEIMKQRGNHNFDTHQPLQKQLAEGVEIRPVSEVFGRR